MMHDPDGSHRNKQSFFSHDNETSKAPDKKIQQLLDAGKLSSDHLTNMQNLGAIALKNESIAELVFDLKLIPLQKILQLTEYDILDALEDADTRECLKTQEITYKELCQRINKERYHELFP